MLSGCDTFDSQLSIGSGLRSFLENANGLTYRAQRLLAGRDALAPEFTEADIRQPQRPNGVTAPDDDTYKGLLANNFADWRLEVSGLVEKPLSLSREQLQNMSPVLAFTSWIPNILIVALYSALESRRRLRLFNEAPEAKTWIRGSARCSGSM